MRALESYLEHQKEFDLEILTKVLPALNSIRFLTLSPTDIANSTLLTPLEIQNVLHYQSSELNGTLFGLSQNRHERRASPTDTEMKMMRALNKIYSSQICAFCAYKKWGDGKHAIWNCGVFQKSSLRRNLEDTFEKYNHTRLLDYTVEDFQTIYNFYSVYGLIDIATTCF